MSNTEMPAVRLTPDCIRNSLESSHKTHLIVTGGRGVGKTTLLSQLFPAPSCGITTWAVRAEAVYMRENRTGKTAVIGEYDSTLGTTENKMRPRPAGFSEVGIPALRACTASESEWITIDEIGYLESACPEYCDALLQLMQKKRLAAAVRKQALPFLEALCRRDDVFLLDLDDPVGHLGCVIMASGLGVRFGGNKLMADFDGLPMIAHALRVTEGIFTRRVVVTRSQAVADYCEEHGAEVILHEMPHRNDTVRLGLLAMEGVDTDGCLFCPGDQPLLSRDTVTALSLAAKNAPQAILRPSFEDTVGAPVLFPRRFYAALLDLPEGKGGGFVAKMHPDAVQIVPVRDPYELADADTPEQLTALLAHKHR